MLVIWTSKRPPLGRRALVPRSCNTSVYLRPYQPSWAPRMHDLPRSVCSCKPCQPVLDTHGFYVRNEGLPVGYASNGPARYPQILGSFQFETFLRSASLGWPYRTLCSYARYLDVSTLQTFKMYILSWLYRQRFRTSQLQLRHR
jgi:hypothetical protein